MPMVREQEAGSTYEATMQSFGLVDIAVCCSQRSLEESKAVMQQVNKFGLCTYACCLEKTPWIS